MYINYGIEQETAQTYEERIKKIQEQLKKVSEYLTTKKPVISPEQKEKIEQVIRPITPPPTAPTPTPSLDIKSLLPLGLLGGFIYFVSRPKEGKVVKRRY